MGKEESAAAKQLISALKACPDCLKTGEWITMCDKHAAERRILADKYGWAIR